MPQVTTIRQLRRSGDTIAEISRKTGLSRDTVYKYLRAEDLSPKIPMERKRKSKCDEYRTIIENWLDEDAKTWRKQRHTAHRIWMRLCEEYGAVISESTVRHYVAVLKRERRASTDAFLDLSWAPGEAQADFGESDFYLAGVRKRISYFVLTFPYSNVGFAQLLPGQNAECVCQGLKSIFEHIGGIPLRIVFDNATGIGRKHADTVRITETFASFCAHYGFTYSFCNPNAGHEKGNVENKVGVIRRNLFVPIPNITNLDAYNAHLLDRCMALSDKPHWMKGEPESQLFMKDRAAMMGLPEHAFDVVRYERPRADKYGKVRLDGCHLYSSDPSLAGCELIAGLAATTVAIYDSKGTFIASHKREYGNVPTDSTQPASQVALLCAKPGGWINSKVRESIPDSLRGHMDSLGREDLKAELRLMREQIASCGWERAIAAMEASLASVGRMDAAAVAMLAAAANSDPIIYDEKVDLDIYDRAVGLAG